MKLFTFSAQVANNLLTVLQGYSKTIRLLLVMFLTLTVTTNAWGEEVTFNPSTDKGSVTANGTNSTGDEVTKSGFTITSSNGVMGNGSNYRVYQNGTLSITSTVGNITAISFTFFSNSYTGGFNSSYTGLSTTSWPASATSQARITKITITYTPTSTTNHAVTWNVNGEVYETTQVTEGSKPTFPATPSSCDATSNTFYGWATATWDGKINDVSAKTIYTSANDMPAVNGAVTYYAVFAKATTTGGGGGSTTYAFGWETADDENNWTISNFSNKGVYSTYTSAGSYAASTNAKTTGYIQYNEKLSPTAISCKYTKATSNINSSSQFFIQKSTDGSSWTAIAEGATMNNVTQGTFKTLSWTGSLSDVYVRIYYTGTTAVRVLDEVSITATGGGGSTTYDNYITTCSGSTPDPIGYTITYNTNGGDVIAATSGTALPNPLPTPTREHYTFVGWYTDEGCTQAATAGATIDADITLYAKWEATMYTVTLNPNYPAGKTGVFKDKEGNTIAGNIEVSLQSGTASQALTNFYSSIELDNYAFDGFYTQAEGGSKRVNTGDITGNITFYAHWKEQHTITWNVNGDTELISPTTFAEGDAWDMPTTDYDCSGKEFVGWTTNPIIAAQDEAPDPLYTNASQFPNATATYYAVFAENTGGGGSGGYKKLTEARDDYSGEYLIVYDDGSVAFNGGLTTLDATSNTIEVTITEGVIASNATTDAAKFTFAKVDGGYSILSASGRYIGRTADSNGLDESTSIAYTNTITEADVVGSGGAHLRYNKDAGQTRFRYYKSSSYTSQQAIALYKKSGSSATYTAYSTSCIPTYSITYDFAGGTGSHCSNTSVQQGDPYTICDEEPTKEGNTFLHWSDSVNTYNPSDVIATVTTDITLTAVWQPNTYTVTWSINGAPNPVEYNHGVALVVPEEPESCDGVKEFVGWTEDNTFTYHATTPPTDLFKTTTATVTADKTYYAVFATPPGTGGGGGGSETNTTLDFTAQGYADATAISNLTVDGVTATFAKGSNGSNAPKYYTNGTAIRAYGGNTITLSANQITAATFTFGSSDGSNDITADCGSWDSPTWTGDATDEVVFTIDGTSGNRRIKSIAVTYTSGGGSGSYSDYTTTCQQVESIEVQNPQTDFYLTDDFTIGSGKVIATLSGGGTTDVTALATFSGYNMEVVGTYTVTVTYMGATATYNINVKALDNAWVLTWNVSGKTNTGLGPRYVTKGSAIGTLPTPEVPAACAGKTFMGWTESNIVPSDGVGIVYITPETQPDDNTTYYAVFATVNNFCTQKPINQIASGSKVVIVAVASLDAGGTTGKAISSRTAADGNNLASDDVFVLDEQINTPHSTCVWTLTREVSGKYTFTQDGKYLNAVVDPDKTTSGFCKFNSTKDTWTISEGATNTYRMLSTNQNKYVEWFTATGVFKVFHIANSFGTFDMQFFVTANANGGADITDYTTGCAEYTITYYGFHGGYSTSCSSDGTIVLPVNSIHTIPNCGDVVTDHTNLGREFLNVWMTQPHGGHTFKPGDTFILTQDTTLYAQWKMETTSDVTTLPTDIEDLAGTDIYVYGGTTLNIQPGTTTINSLTLKGGLQADGSYKMPTVWVPEGATLVRNSNKIYLDLVVNAENWYPFAVPFETKNTSDIHYLHPDMRAAATYGQHFDIKTYDGARRADVGEDKANNWVRLKRHTTAEPVSFKPGIGYIISAMAYPGEDTATIRIPMSVPNTWFKNGEQAEVGTTVRNTIAVTAHDGAAATEHQRHAGWNFVANPYLTSFTGGNVANDGSLAYINGELIIEGSYVYGGDPVPYVTVPAYDFAYYSQHKLSDVKLSPEWSFFVQVGIGGTMNFTTAGRQQAPASIAARNAEERPVKMDVDLILSDNHSSDQTGLIICDRYTDAYEIGRDLEKLFGSAYNLSVYTLMEDNTPLAFQALAIRSSMQVIPVGYRAPEQGEYTFRLNEATSSIDLLNEQYEQLVLVDYQTGELTNLLYTDYTFYSERTQSNSRFAIYAVPRQNAPTDLPNAIGSDEEVRKVIYNDHLYILRDGNVYNGMGQKM